MKNHLRTLVLAPFLLVAAVAEESSDPSRTVLDKQETLEKQTFWDNRDWTWFAENIPMLETPDAEIDTTCYDPGRLGNPELRRARKERFLRRQAQHLGFTLTPLGG